MKTILVIRELDNSSCILAKNGFEIINLPMIETKPIDNLGDFKAKLAEIGNYDGIFITSRHAAQLFRENLPKNYRGKVYILGRRSFKILKDAHLELIFNESANTAQEMLENIASNELKNKHFLFVRGEQSLRIVPEFLGKLAKVDEAIVYETRKIKPETDKINEIREKIIQGEIAAACFFSPSGAEAFLEQFSAEILHQTLIATIGKTTAEYFERQDLKVDFVSPKSNAEDFAVELIDYLRRNLAADERR